MVWYDFVMLGILVIAAWQGAARGLIMQLTWIVAIVLCFKFSDKLSPSVEPLISVESEKLRHWIAMLVLYLGFSLGTFLVARSLSNAIEKAKFQEFDRQLGGLFGLLKGALVCLVVTFFAVTLSENLRQTVRKSKTGHIACVFLDNAQPLIPEDAHPVIHSTLERYDSRLNLGDHLGEEVSPDEVLANGLWGDTEDLDRDHDSTFDFGHDEDSASRRAGQSYSMFLSQLSRQWQDRIGDSLLSEWNNLSANEQTDLIALLKDRPDSVAGDLLRQWFGGTDSRQGSGAGGRGTGRVLTAIANEYPYPETILRRTREAFSGVPSGVQEAVLEDWYADLMMTRDPDPSTDSTTRINDRILRQLHRQRVALNSLPYNVRQRLQE